MNPPPPPQVRPAAPYQFTPAFERVLGLALITRPRVFGLLGKSIDIERLTLEETKLCLRLATLCAQETGHGPGDIVIALQRAHRLYERDLFTQEQVDTLAELYIMLGGHTGGLPSDDDIVEQAAPVLRRDLEKKALVKAMELHGSRRELDQAVEMLQTARAVGKVDRSHGLKLGAGALGAIRRLRAVDRLSTGVPELDCQIGGGLPRANVLCWSAKAKGGKSFALTGMAADALQRGLFVVLATLELSEELQTARLMAALTGIPIDAILDGTADADVELALEALAPSLGIFRVKFFPAKVTTVPTMAAWISEVEAEEGCVADVFLCDYIDLAASSNRAHVSSHDIQEQSASDFRLYVVGRQLWGGTASQPRRADSKDSKSKPIDIDDLAGSMGKARVFDALVTATRPNEDQVELYVAGCRFARDKFSLGPFQTDLARGRLVARMKPDDADL